MIGVSKTSLMAGGFQSKASFSFFLQGCECLFSFTKLYVAPLSGNTN